MTGTAGGAQTPSADASAVPAPFAARLSHAEQEAASAREALTPPPLADEDRSWIARLIVRSFIAAVLIYLLLLAIQGAATGAWANVADKAEDMIKSIVVPIVTLVLGYYFGQSRKS